MLVVEFSHESAWPTAGQQCWEAIAEDVSNTAAAIQDARGSQLSPEPPQPAESDFIFFRVMDTTKAFSQLTLLGDTSAFLNVDFIAHTFRVVSMERTGLHLSGNQPVKATIVPTGATLSDPYLQESCS